MSNREVTEFDSCRVLGGDGGFAIVGKPSLKNDAHLLGVLVDNPVVVCMSSIRDTRHGFHTCVTVCGMLEYEESRGQFRVLSDSNAGPSYAYFDADDVGTLVKKDNLDPVIYLDYEVCEGHSDDLHETVAGDLGRETSEPS